MDWYFAVYEGIELVVLYKVAAKKLEPDFTAWETKWTQSGGKDINNPKIPLKFVESIGKIIHQADSISAVMPAASAITSRVKDIEKPD